ncbi:MAG: hypothetical protein JKY08_07415, partial [Flavobacteriaceae bacterium]|nr:hypothetical protein [Flavobacteriaceae bacterium]
QENGAGGKQDNNIKTIITKSGHKIEFNDTPRSESITITDRKGNHIIIDTQNENISINALKNINITAGETMTLTAENLNINVAQNMNTNIGMNAMLSVGIDYIKRIGSNYKLRAANIFKRADKKLEVQAVDIQNKSSQITMSSKKNIDIHSSEKILSNSGEKTNLF